jgi:hypothetical protein
MPRWFANRPAALLLPVLLTMPLQSQREGSPQRAAFAIPDRESLTYQIEWRLIQAGRARLDWERVGNPASPLYQLQLHLESVGLVSKLFKVDDWYTSQLASRFCALNSTLRANEGSKQHETRVTYDGGRRKASAIERDVKKNSVVGMNEVEIPACVHDVMGALYLLRTMRLEVGQQARVPVSDGKRTAMARAEAQDREEIKTPAGTFRTVRYEAFLFNDVLYRRKARLFIWLTDDERRLPVQIRVRMQIHIGTITLQLEKKG